MQLTKTFSTFLLFFVGASIGCPFDFSSNSTSSGGLSANFRNLTENCVRKLGLNLESVTDDVFRSAEAEDRCLAKCILQSLDLASENKLLDRDAFFELLEDRAPKSLLIKLTEIVNKCADSTQVDVLQPTAPPQSPQQQQPKKNKVFAAAQQPAIGAGSCKTYHAFLVCLSTQAEALC